MANKEHLEILKRGVKAWNKWREKNPPIEADFSRADLSEVNLIGANLIGANLSFANLIETNLSGANLSGANLIRADLSRANFSEANLIEANLIEANLIEANFSEANLSFTDLSEADLSFTNLIEANLIEAKFREADLNGANLSGANLSFTNLSGANLSGANLSGANLSGANLSGANLSGANLRTTQALKTNFTKAILTGACIEGWNINNKTQLENIKCDYIFLKSTGNENRKKNIYDERRPHQKDQTFQDGDWERLVKKSQKTVDLILSKGMNWQAFLYSYEQLKLEAGGDFFSIQSFENNEDNSFRVRIKTPTEVNPAKIQKSFEEKYEQKLQLIESKYRSELNAKDIEIEGYKRENTNLWQLAKLAANQPTNIEENFRANNNPETFNNYQQGANIANNANIVKDNARRQANQYNYTPEQKQSLAEAATEIQELLNQLSETYSETEAEQKVAEDLANRAKQDPSFKEKLKTWSQSILTKSTEAGAIEFAKEGAKRVIPLALSFLI